MMLVPVNEVLDELDAPRNQEWRRFQVNYPVSSLGDFEIQRFGISRDDAHRIWTIQSEGINRDPGSGEFTRLVEKVKEADNSFTENDERYRVWMSDTRAEILELYPLFNQLWWSEHVLEKRLLINGLGLGVAVHGALTYKGIAHIDVVESNPVVAELVSRYLPEDKVTVHVGDAFTMKWPRGTRWDGVWSDIWPTISDENLPEMTQLKRKYASRAGWHKAWQEEGCRKMSAVYKKLREGTLDPNTALEILGGKFHL